MIKEITLRYQTSYDYQVVDMSITLTDPTSEEIASVKENLIKEASSAVKELSSAVGSRHPDKKETVSKAPSKPSYYNKPKAPVPPVPTAPKYQGMMNSYEPKVGDLKEINGQTYKLCFNKNNGEWFYANQGETTNECPKYIKYE